MAKKQKKARRRGVSGNPAKRAAQEWAELEAQVAELARQGDADAQTLLHEMHGDPLPYGTSTVAAPPGLRGMTMSAGLRDLMGSTTPGGRSGEPSPEFWEVEVSRMEETREQAGLTIEEWAEEGYEPDQVSVRWFAEWGPADPSSGWFGIEDSYHSVPDMVAGVVGNIRTDSLGGTGMALRWKFADPRAEREVRAAAALPDKT